MGFAVLANHGVKENEKRDKYVDLAREQEKLWNMKVTVIPVVIGALGIILKGLVNGLDINNDSDNSINPLGTVQEI